MKLEHALYLAESAMDLLAPHCERIEIAGSIRRRRPEVEDIEIVAIPKPYDVGRFESGIATVVNLWPRVRGELPCLYTRRRLTGGMELDLFVATPENWGYILAIRTGSADYSHKVLARKWRRRGFAGRGGMLYNSRGQAVDVREEEDVFAVVGLAWVPPELREVE